MKRILVLGSSGMLGHVVTATLESAEYDVVGLSYPQTFGKQSVKLDLTKGEEFEAFLQNNIFDCIVNCAAVLVAQSEQKKDLGIYMNAYLPRYLEQKFLDSKTKIIHVSTAGVFSGKESRYGENNIADTEIFYGKIKHLGEINNEKDLTIRSDFWGPDLNKQSASLFNWALSHENKKGFTGEMFNGVSSVEFARFLLTAMEDATGIFHLVAEHVISKFEFLRSLNEAFSLCGDIIPTQGRKIDRSLANNRRDIYSTEKNYHEMLSEAKEWIQKHSAFYPHYVQFL